ncbi:hypothetical protein EDD99_2635 [Streptomyces sp. 846.5]|nr:hypothetical protein EDD99_2635 [Streptomyces sp. 846.5]
MLPASAQAWQATFPGTPEHAATLRRWARQRLHPWAGPRAADDAVQLAHQLFTAVLTTHPDRITVTLARSTTRIRITAAGPSPLPPRARADWGITRALATAHGRGPRSAWAELATEPREHR